MSKSILTACVVRMKGLALTGKGRDDAADHFLAGARAALDACRDSLSTKQEDETDLSGHVPVLADAKGYTTVLEAMALAE